MPNLWLCKHVDIDELIYAYISAQAAASPLEIENLTEIIEDFKMVLVVRNDLKMGKGTIAAQCSHATLGLFKRLQQRAPKSLRRWEQCGQVKVVVKIESEEDMLVLQVYFPIEQDVGNEATIAF